MAADLTDVSTPELDFIAMNPPFTRSVGGSQLLGSLEDKAFVKARERLKELVNRSDVPATLTAGLGAPFVELALRCLKPKGRLALVLPKTMLTGEAWEETRARLASSCHVEYIINVPRERSLELQRLDQTLRGHADRPPHAAGVSGEPRTIWIALSRNPERRSKRWGTLQRSEG